MMKHEFEQILNRINKENDKNSREVEISTENYEIVETVYNWHPTINNVSGKHQIAMIYTYGGMQAIRDMHATALLAKGFDDEETRLQLETLKVNEEYNQRCLELARVRATEIERINEELKIANEKKRDFLKAARN